VSFGSRFVLLRIKVVIFSSNRSCVKSGLFWVSERRLRNKNVKSLSNINMASDEIVINLFCGFQCLGTKLNIWV